MLKTLVALPERCTGCHRCEMRCSMKHKGVINVERAAILGLQYAVSHRGACHMHPNWASTWDAGKFESGFREFGLPWPPAPESRKDHR